MKRWTTILAAATAMMAAVTGFATEGGGGAYPNGAEGFMTGAVPPPGNYAIVYGLYYSADELVGPDGNDLMGGLFDLEVSGAVLRYIHVTDIKVLGGNWAQHIFVPLLNVDVTLPDGAGGTLCDNKFGLGDLIVDPVIVSWHTKNLHAAAGVDTYVPVGAYDENDLANVGRNYWTFEPVVACTYLNGPIEVSAKVMYDINLENDDTKVESGDELHADFMLAAAVKQWRVGVSGFAYKQVEDDSYPAGYPDQQKLEKGQQLGLGPAIAYQHGPIMLVAKYQKELETENKPEGERVWVKLVAPLPW
jgi:hypothetical protein